MNHEPQTNLPQTLREQNPSSRIQTLFSEPVTLDSGLYILNPISIVITRGVHDGIRVVALGVGSLASHSDSTPLI